MQVIAIVYTCSGSCMYVCIYAVQVIVYTCSGSCMHVCMYIRSAPIVYTCTCSGSCSVIHVSVAGPIHLRTYPSTEEWAEKVALLKCKCFASVFQKYFQLQRDGKLESTAIIHYRDRETM